MSSLHGRVGGGTATLRGLAILGLPEPEPAAILLEEARVRREDRWHGATRDAAGRSCEVCGAQFRPLGKAGRNARNVVPIMGT